MSSQSPLYFIALLLPNDISEAVKTYKKEMKEKFNSSYAYRKKSHITLQKPFRIDPQQTERYNTLHKSLSGIAEQLQPFDITLSGFDHFGSSVLYVDVSPNESLSHLRNEIRTVLQKNLQFDGKMLGRSSFTPHITIANRDLNKEAFYKAWKVFGERTFEQSFTCDCFWLLEHNESEWVPHTKFAFLNRNQEK